MEDKSTINDNRSNLDHNIIKYMQLIRHKLMEFVPWNATPENFNLTALLDEHLDNAVVETIVEVNSSSKTHVDLHPDTLRAITHAARLGFIRNERLLYSAEPTESIKSNNPSTGKNSIVCKGYSDNSYVLKNKISAKQKKELIEDALKSNDAESSLSHDVRFEHKRNIERMLKNAGSISTYDSQVESEIQAEFMDKQKLAKNLLQQLGSMSLELDALSYMNIEKLADYFVTDIIKVAKRTVKEHQLKMECTQWGTDAIRQMSEEPSQIDFVEIFGSFAAWPTIGEFSIEIGADRISDYLATWHYSENWLYDLDMVLAQSDACSDFYVYEVKWSIPTKEYPVPQATASVFFTVEVSRVLPPNCFVNVTYKFEGCDYMHEPFKHSFQERWLFNIVEDKLKFFQTITF